MPGWLVPWLILIGGFVVVLGVLVVFVLLAFVSRGSRPPNRADPDRVGTESGHDGDPAARVPCPACGAPVESTSKYCGRCGRAMSRGDAPPGTRCTYCGRELSADDRFCTECGRDVPGDVGEDSG